MSTENGSKALGAAGGQKKSGLGGTAILVLFSLCILASLSSGTQYLAWQYNYATVLGSPLTGTLYYPWQGVQWALDWHESDPALYEKAGIIMASIGGMVFALFGVIYFTVRRKAKPHESLHGTARWATKDEIIDSGLLPQKGESSGVFVGGWVDGNHLHYLRHYGPEHISVFAPTRSGKGVALVVPTLLSWPHSLVAYDIKGEAWALTSGWRQKYAHNKVLRFDPTDTSGMGAHFNPMAEIRIGQPEEVGDAQNLASIIADPEGKGLTDHWMKTGHAFLVGSILHVLYKAKAEGKIVASLPDLSLFLSDPNRTLEDSIQAMMHFQHLPSGVHVTVAQSARDMLNREERERSAVHSTCVSFLTLFRDPIVALNSSESHFAIDDLMNHDQPVSLYIVIKPSDKDRLRPLVRIVLTQIIRRLMERMEFEDGATKQHYKHRLLLLLDELASLGKLAVLEDSLAYMAGYGIKAYMIFQDITQLHKAYTKDESIISASHIRTAFAPNKMETAELLSRMTGKTTVIKKSTSQSGSRYSASLNRISETVQEVERPLLTADECMRLPAAKKNADGTKILEPGDMLIMAAGFNAIYGKQPLYFLDPVLSERSKIPSPISSDRITREEIDKPVTRVQSKERISALFAEVE
ncbi:MAG: type IV secretory system conjugative DNA transfer family protein [bacterium]|nr:type IV secretory system conjugative DNA transfer family protein [bacterium]